MSRIFTTLNEVTKLREKSALTKQVNLKYKAHSHDNAPPPKNSRVTVCHRQTSALDHQGPVSESFLRLQLIVLCRKVVFWLNPVKGTYNNKDNSLKRYKMYYVAFYYITLLQYITTLHYYISSIHYINIRLLQVL